MGLYLSHLRGRLETHVRHAEQLAFEQHERRDDISLPLGAEHEGLRPAFEITPELLAQPLVHRIAAQYIVQFELSAVQVDAGMYATVVAGGSARADVVRLFDEEHLDVKAGELSCERAPHDAAAHDEHDVKTGELSCERAPHDAAAHDEHVRRPALERVVAEGWPFRLLVETFQLYVVEDAERALAHRRDPAAVDGVPALQLA